MPNFQGAINQVLGMAGAFKKIDDAKPASPEEVAEARKQQELESLDRKSKVLEQAAEVAGKGLQADVEGTVANLTSKDIAKEQTEVARRQFELDPTQERYKNYSLLRSAGYDAPLMKLPADPDEIRAEQAMAEAEAKQEAMRKNLERRRQHIMNMRTSLGGRVGDFKEPLRSMVIDEYMKQEGDSNE